MANEDNLNLAITVKADTAEAAIRQFSDSASKGLASAAREGAKAAIQLDDLEKKVAELKASGQNVDDFERQLAQLNDEFDRGRQVLGRNKAAQEDFRKELEKSTVAAGGDLRALTSLHDVAEKLPPSFSRIAGAVTAVTGTFAAAYAEGSRLRKLLNDLTEGGFDKWIKDSLFNFDALVKSGVMPKVVSDFLGLADAQTQARQEAENLLNQQKVLKANGIDPTILSLQEQAEVYDQLAKSHAAAALAEEKLTKTEEETTKAVKEAKEPTAQLADERNRLADATKRASDEALKLAQAGAQAAQGQVADLEKRRQELESKGPLNAAESEELLSLTRQQAEAQNDLAQANQKVTAAELERNQALQRSTDLTRDALDAANEALSKEIERQKIIDEQADGYGRAVESVGKLEDGNAALTNVLSDQGVVLDKNAEGWQLYGEGAKKAGKEVEGTGEKVQDLNKEMKAAGEEGSKSAKTLHEEAGVLKTDFTELIDLVRTFKAELATMGG